MDFNCGNLSTDKGKCYCLCAIDIRNKKKVKLNGKGVPRVEARLIVTTVALSCLLRSRFVQYTSSGTD